MMRLLKSEIQYRKAQVHTIEPRVTHDFTRLLLSRDLKILNDIDSLIEAVDDQSSFDAIFGLLFHHERTLVIRAADAVEKITRNNPEYLIPHTERLLGILNSASRKELKWHVAQLIPRLQLSEQKLMKVWNILTYWTLNRNENKMVRVNALQALFDLSENFSRYKSEFIKTMTSIAHEMIPSLNARIRKIRRQLSSVNNLSTTAD